MSRVEQNNNDDIIDANFSLFSLISYFSEEFISSDLRFEDLCHSESSCFITLSGICLKFVNYRTMDAPNTPGFTTGRNSTQYLRSALFSFSEYTIHSYRLDLSHKWFRR